MIPLAAAYALTFAQEKLVAELHELFSRDEPVDPADTRRRELETLAAGLKAVATWQATATIQACREACGGMGYSAEMRFASLKADTDVFTTFEGDNTVLMQLCAKNLLTGYRDELGELDPLGVATFVAGQVFETIVERTGVGEVLGRLADELLPGRDDEGDLLERETQLALLRWRQEHILQGAARRLKGGMDAGQDPFSVLVDCQDHVVDCARAWVDLVVAEAFAEAVERCEHPGSRAALERLCSLHVLARVEAERGWYQEHGRLSSTRSKAVIKAVNALCREVRADARELVDAFAIPESLLRAEQPNLKVPGTFR
jgi:acyl-CoA oxidase